MEKQIKEVLKQEVSKSQKMIQLYELGLEVSEIAKLMNVRYNFVYNVVSNKARMEGETLRKVEKVNKKAQILALIEEGKNNTEIAKELKANYTYVYTVRKDYEQKKRLEEAEAK